MSNYTAISIPAGQNSITSSRSRTTQQSYDEEKTSGATEHSVNRHSFVVFGKDFTKSSDVFKFCICSTGVFGFYLIYGYMQELIFSLPGFKPFGWYLTLVQFACYSFTGTLEVLISKKKFKRRIPLKTYALLAFLTVATMGLSNTSVGYLNYPTQVIFKCCKLIPVMLGGILIQGTNLENACPKHHGNIELLFATKIADLKELLEFFHYFPERF
ncbi:adenosine 3'-phospho 5'-phosphosulfate transporter 2-like isoform X1 [Rhopilema esculentum]|uniref:adenosine 3'-phospho 5'-phosphosulfate transporter 2-like isoform X1 n=1 Tax=Rhopilema esculentum TaxID=499914 RepID=UPI0031D331D3